MQSQTKIDMDIKKKYRPYIGINIRSNQITLSTEFCNRYVKENTYAALYWDEPKKMLGIIFYPTDNFLTYRIPLINRPQTNRAINCVKFLSQLGQFRIGRYEVIDVDVTRTGDIIFKFKLEYEN